MIKLLQKGCNMFKKLGVLAAVAAALLLAGQGFAKSDRVIVCHKGKTITVGSGSVGAHLSHGDTLGACS
jgi:hypothetical protein